MLNRGTLCLRAIAWSTLSISFLLISGCQGATPKAADTKKTAASVDPSTGDSTKAENSTSPATPANGGPTASVPTIAPAPSPTPATPVPAPAPPPADPVATTEKSAGCSAPNADLKEGVLEFKVGELNRKFVVRLPAKYSKDKAWPLVLALHPNGSNTSFWDGTTGSRALRPLLADKAIVIVAQARVDDWRGDYPAEDAYFEALLIRAKAGLCVDTKRIYSMGFSGGGSYSGRLGCTRTDIRAIAVGGAIEYFEPAKCVGKPAVWVTIGDDEAIPDRITFRDFWRDYNKCTKVTKVLTPATCVAYTCPDALHPVNFCSHTGGHEWPAFGIKTAWDFFSQF